VANDAVTDVKPADKSAYILNDVKLFVQQYYAAIPCREDAGNCVWEDG